VTEPFPAMTICNTTFPPMPGLRSSNQQCEFALEHPSGNVGQSVSNGVEERIEVVDVHVRSDERRRFA
jgi:hypothetical protein